MSGALGGSWLRLDVPDRVCFDARMMRSVLALAAMGVLAGGCPDDAASESGGEPSSESDEPSIVLVDFHPPDVAELRETWKDKASGLMFTTPGSGWTRLEGDALSALGADVKLAVKDGERCSGWVRVSPAAGLGARAAADAGRAALPWQGMQVQVDEDVKYDLWTARRYEVQGRLEGRVVAERASYWLEYGNLYAVVARTNDRDYASRRRCLDRVTAGFALGMPAP